MTHLRNVHNSDTVKDKIIPAMSGIDLSIVRGEIFGVTGRSGAGKSSLIRLIHLLQRSFEGGITVEGEEVATYDALALRNFRRNIGMVFQHVNLLSSRTVAVVLIAMVDACSLKITKIADIKDTLILESGPSNYVNLLAARADNKDRPAMKKRVAALLSSELKTFILERCKGNLVPAF
ncbi:MAG: MetQ/NlpA family ABC transporter substrate-binding protein [Polaromonas sp.]|nr:MetQ/NlpA family ABC transporter substrate-binding protein [Polaromonas sp.]